MPSDMHTCRNDATNGHQRPVHDSPVCSEKCPFVSHRRRNNAISCRVDTSALARWPAAIYFNTLPAAVTPQASPRLSGPAQRLIDPPQQALPAVLRCTLHPFCLSLSLSLKAIRMGNKRGVRLTLTGTFPEKASGNEKLLATKLFRFTKMLAMNLCFPKKKKKVSFLSNVSAPGGQCLRIPLMS